MTVKSGSYCYDSFGEKTQVQEFERLYRQASTLLDTERQLWPGMGIITGQKVLDLGCGSGVITRELAKQVYPARAVGIDISKTLIDKGLLAYAESSQRTQKNVDFQQGSVYNLPFPDNSFDIVYARLLFQHLDAPLQALASALRVLKPGGKLFILDVDKSWSSLYPEPKSSMELDKAIIQKQLSQGGDPWVGRKLSYYLTSAGFESVETKVTLVDSNRLGMAHFFGMLAFGGSYQSEENKLAALQEKCRPDIQVLLDDPSAWAGFGLFVAVGHKTNRSM
ncbi:MAG: methyltransferase domain-containing protein [Phormidesmis sp.]